MSGTLIFSSKPLAISDSFALRSVPLCRASDLSLPPRKSSRFDAFRSLADADAGRSVPAAAVATAFEIKSRRLDVWNARAVSAEAHIARMVNCTFIARLFIPAAAFVITRCTSTRLCRSGLFLSSVSKVSWRRDLIRAAQRPRGWYTPHKSSIQPTTVTQQPAATQLTETRITRPAAWLPRPGSAWAGTAERGYRQLGMEKAYGNGLCYCISRLSGVIPDRRLCRTHKSASQHQFASQSVIEYVTNRASVR